MKGFIVRAAWAALAGPACFDGATVALLNLNGSLATEGMFHGRWTFVDLVSGATGSVKAR